jgi:hypothetical protein
LLDEIFLRPPNPDLVCYGGALLSFAVEYSGPDTAGADVDP